MRIVLTLSDIIDLIFAFVVLVFFVFLIVLGKINSKKEQKLREKGFGEEESGNAD